MLVTNHVLSGALLGTLARRPLPGFLAGALSHFVLDAVPHWGACPEEEFLPVAVRDGLTGLAAMAAVGAVSRPTLRGPVVAAMVGAAFPDLDKPARLFLGRSPFPRAVDAFHVRIQRESPHRMRQEIVVGALLAGFAFAAVRPRAAHRR